MCGIAGVFGQKNPHVVSHMLHTLIHRGPDDGYQVAGDGFTLGARRLSIIDVDGGRQPLASRGGDVWAAQNGEIYNFRELRTELAASGHTFTTRCDTEVIAEAYVRYGASVPEHLDGMFAISIYDERRATGMLARDRAGKKPLYYVEHERCLWFASEIKALWCIPGLARRIDWEAIHHYWSYKHVPAPLSAFEGIRVLPPAHRLIWSEGTIQKIEPYWHLSFESVDTPRDEDELVDDFLDRLKAGVRRRLVSDVPIGFFLSGGVDSSLSTCIAAELNPDPIETFTLTYSDDSATDGKRADVACARAIAKTYGTRHHEEEIDYRSFPQDFPRIISHFDEPFSGVVSTWFLARLISRHVKVALSGDGADELFGSYLSHRLAQPLADYRATRDAGGNASPAGSLFEGRPGYLEDLCTDEDWEWRYRLLTFDEEEKLALYAPALRARMRQYSTRRNLQRAFEGLTARDPLNRILEAEFRSFFPDQVLTFVDRLSMAHSLEVRTAFLDTAVMEFVAQLPARFKIRRTDVGETTSWETKYLLKKAALRYLPADVVYRPKEGFVLPINGWLLTHLGDYVRDMLSSDRLTGQGWLDPQAVQNVVRRFQGGETRLANKILSLLAFQVWVDVCYHAPVPSEGQACAS